MVQMFPFVSRQFEKALGKNLGIARLPQSGHGPFAGKVAGNSFHNWVIPKNAQQRGRRVGVHQAGDRQDVAAASLATLVGALPTNRAALAATRIRSRRFFPQALGEAADAAARQHRPA